YGYILPFVLYATWVAVAMWDLIRQESAPLPHRARWMLIVLVVPFLGPLLYFAFGRSPIPRQLRLLLTAGGTVVYPLFLRVRVRLLARPFDSVLTARAVPTSSVVRTCVPPSACLSRPSMSITRIGSTSAGIRLALVRIRSGSPNASSRGRNRTCTSCPAASA